MSHSFSEKNIKMIRMWFLLGSVPNKHVSLHVKNVIFGLGHRCRTSPSFIMICCDTFYLHLVKKCSSSDFDIALGHITIHIRFLINCSALLFCSILVPFIIVYEALFRQKIHDGTSLNLQQLAMCRSVTFWKPATSHQWHIVSIATTLYTSKLIASQTLL